MVVVDVQPNGQAPQGLSPGDFVNTYGNHLYQIAEPGTYGAVYNPASGYWSYDTQSEDYRIMSLINSAKASAEENTLTSQEFAREQMAFQQNSAEKAMQFSAEQAAMNRDWQERLSNSAHQREVKDLIAAGLNPVLSAHGQGASTPSGATAAGVTNSGASGSVDTGGTAAAAQMLMTMLNNQNALDITKLQTAATMYAADKGFLGSQAVAGGTLGAANISAANAYAMMMKQLQYDAWKTENYPSNWTQGIGVIIGAINDILEGNGNSSNTVFNLAQNGKEFLKALDHYLRNDLPGWMYTDYNVVTHQRETK